MAIMSLNNNNNNNNNNFSTTSSTNTTTSNHLLINNPAYPIIRLPFPPQIDPSDLIPIKPSSQEAKEPNFKPSRAPNAFIIYRKAFVKAAREEGQCLPMTVISSMASSSWEHEPIEVKEEYKRIAKAAYLKRKEMYPKERKRRRKEKWNIVSFNSPITTTTSNDNNNNNNNNNTDNTIISNQVGSSSSSNSNNNNNNSNSNDINDNIIVSNNNTYDDLLSPPSLSCTSSSPSPIFSEFSPRIDSVKSNDGSIVIAAEHDNNHNNYNNYNNESLLLSTSGITDFQGNNFNEKLGFVENNIWEQKSLTEFDNGEFRIYDDNNNNLYYYNYNNNNFSIVPPPTFNGGGRLFYP